MKLRFELMNNALHMSMAYSLEPMSSSSDYVSLALNTNPKNIRKRRSKNYIEQQSMNSSKQLQPVHAELAILLITFILLSIVFHRSRL